MERHCASKFSKRQETARKWGPYRRLTLSSLFDGLHFKVYYYLAIKIFINFPTIFSKSLDVDELSELVDNPPHQPTPLYHQNHNQNIQSRRPSRIVSKVKKY
jgi:hypothetical protein